MPALPSANASAEAVRDYLFLLLTGEFQLSDQSALDATKNWRYGSGYELRTFDAETFRALLGNEVGAIVHSRVQYALKRREDIKTNKLVPIGILIGISALCCIVSLILLLIHFMQNPHEPGERLVKAAVISTMLTFNGTIFYRVLKTHG